MRVFSLAETLKIKIINPNSNSKNSDLDSKCYGTTTNNMIINERKPRKAYQLKNSCILETTTHSMPEWSASQEALAAKTHAELAESAE